MYALILYFSIMNSNHGVAATTVPGFSDLPSCQAAFKAVQKQVKDAYQYNDVRGVCAKTA